RLGPDEGHGRGKAEGKRRVAWAGHDARRSRKRPAGQAPSPPLAARPGAGEKGGALPHHRRRQIAVPTTLAPFSNRTFRDLWLASQVSNLGSLIQGVGAAWAMGLMTES